MALLDDLRPAIRALRQSPGFAAIALATLALGIGANSAIFSVLDRVLLAPLPYAEPDRLAAIEYVDSEQPGGRSPNFSPQDFTDLATSLDAERPRGGPIERIAAYRFVPGLTGMNLTGGDEPERIDVATVTGEFFPLLGIRAALGRALLASDDTPGRDRVVVLSDALWRRRFSSDPAVVGRAVTLEGETFTVVGVMPPSFAMPAREVDLWAPMSIVGEDDIPHRRGLRWMAVVARLAPGASPDAAGAAASAVVARLARAYPETNAKLERAVVRPLSDVVAGGLRPALLVLLGAVALVLLIACANLANLLLARITARRGELAVRVALGAGPARLARQILVENAVLALGGGALGLLAAHWGVRALIALGGADLPRLEDARPDARVILFTVAIALATGLLSGIVPALRAARAEARDALGKGGRGSDGADGVWTRTLLVGAETALAVLLLIGASLMIRSFDSLLAVDPGFRADRVLTLSLSVADGRFEPRELAGAHERILAQLREIPGVVAVGASKTLPLHGGGEAYDFAIEGRPTDERVSPAAGTFIVTPEAFAALGIPLLAGRDFSARDGVSSPPVVIVNRALAREVWPGGNAVGRRILIGPTGVEVVGVVGDVRQEGIATPPRPALYIPHTIAPRSTMKVFIRTAGDPIALAEPVRRAIRTIDPDQPIADLAPMGQVLSEAVARPRFTTFLLALFGALALGLAALGTYGVVAYAVSQRTREIGIRMALGARRGEILAQVVRGASAVTLGGLAVGVVVALASTRLLASLLFGVSTTDPLAFVAAPLVLAAVALVASAIPARRAARLDPLSALRRE